MIKYVKKIDSFGRNIILVFSGMFLVNLFNLFYQLLIAHRLSGSDFAGFNSLLAIFTLIAAPLVTLQAAVAKYSAEFNAQNQYEKTQALLSNLLKRILPFAVITFIIFCLFSFLLMNKLKIPSVLAGYILAALAAFSWITPVFSGAFQGLELFKWLVAISIISGVFKVLFAFVFIDLGFNITGALGAFLLASLTTIVISIVPLKKIIFSSLSSDGVDFKGFFLYLVPLGLSLFCFMSLVNLDMVLVKYIFNPVDAGFYSLAQMLGKIFLFLPAAINIVMFPKIAGLKARNMDTAHTLKRSLLYAFALCVIANLVYNFFPGLILKILTGKAFDESILLGRLFGISMSFFTLLLILINYFLCIKDLRFMKYLILSALLQPLAIFIFHKNIMQVQLVLCVNSVLIFFVLLAMANRKK